MNKSRIEAAGFTLIEVMVALAIAGIGLVALVAAVGNGIGGAGLAGRYIEATRRAESRLAALGAVEPLVPGEQSGDDGDGYRWRIRIAQPLLHLEQGASSPALYVVEVEISWQEDGHIRSVALETQRASQIAIAPSHG